jgi:hypothetical protein
MYKVGDVREDGLVFRGYRKGANGLLEHWVSAESFARRKLHAQTHDKKRRAQVQADPEKRAKNNADMATYMRESRRLRPKVHMLVRARSRAKAKGVPFDVSVGDITIPKRCPVLNLPLRVSDGYADDQSPELDRVVPSRGYVRGNVVVVSRRANRIKNDATVKELQQVASFYAGFKPKT